MIKVGLFTLALIQSAILAMAQVLLKLGLQRMPQFSWSMDFWRETASNWQFALSGLCFAAASILWMYIIRHYPFSMAYPLVSLSYVFGLVAAMIFFHEQVDLGKWLGVLMIMIGCYIIAK